MCGELSCSGFSDYNCGLCVANYCVPFSTNTTVGSVWRAIVLQFQRLLLCVLCGELSCSGFNDYNCALCVANNCVTVSTTTTAPSVRRTIV